MSKPITSAAPPPANAPIPEKLRALDRCFPAKAVERAILSRSRDLYLLRRGEYALDTRGYLHSPTYPGGRVAFVDYVFDWKTDRFHQSPIEVQLEDNGSQAPRARRFEVVVLDANDLGLAPDHVSSPHPKTARTVHMLDVRENPSATPSTPGLL